MTINKTIEFIANERPHAKHEIEQYLMKPQSLYDQLLLSKRLDNKKILFLGDDDHLSIVLAYYLNIESVVLEVDRDVLNSHKNLKHRLSLSNHKVFLYDIVYPMNLWSDYDAFVINPPYGSKNDLFGAKVWTSRAVSVIKNKGLGLTILPICFDYKWSTENMIKYQAFLSSIGLCMYDINHNIHEYYATHKHPDLRSSNIWSYKVKHYPDMFGVITENLYR